MQWDVVGMAVALVSDLCCSSDELGRQLRRRRADSLNS